MSARRAARRPARRGRIAAGLLVGIGTIAGIVLLAESLERPLPVHGAALRQIPQPPADPRRPPECPEDLPSDGGPIDVGSNELFDCPEAFHRRSVRYRGEAVGSVLGRRGGAWVQLNDDVYAGAGSRPSHAELRGGNAGLGVLLPVSVADRITVLGGPRARGDVLEIVGTFHRFDARTREVAVIHADEAVVVSRGQVIAPSLLGDRLLAAIGLTIVAAASVLGHRRAVRRRRTRS